MKTRILLKRVCLVTLFIIVGLASCVHAQTSGIIPIKQVGQSDLETTYQVDLEGNDSAQAESYQVWTTDDMSVWSPGILVNPGDQTFSLPKKKDFLMARVFPAGMNPNPSRINIIQAKDVPRRPILKVAEGPPSDYQRALSLQIEVADSSDRLSLRRIFALIETQTAPVGHVIYHADVTINGIRVQASGYANITHQGVAYHETSTKALVVFDIPKDIPILKPAEVVDVGFWIRPEEVHPGTYSQGEILSVSVPENVADLWEVGAPMLTKHQISGSAEGQTRSLLSDGPQAEFGSIDTKLASEHDSLDGTVQFTYTFSLTGEFNDVFVPIDVVRAIQTGLVNATENSLINRSLVETALSSSGAKVVSDREGKEYFQIQHGATEDFTVVITGKNRAGEFFSYLSRVYFTTTDPTGSKSGDIRFNQVSLDTDVFRSKVVVITDHL